MIFRAALLLLVVLSAFGAGYLLGDRREAPARPALSCTPSAPRIVVKAADAPVVLFWGNSLLHDHQWEIAGAVSVNCAMQGLTASAAASIAPSLPDVDPNEIVLAFGSVELIRSARGATLAVPEFVDAVAANVASLQNKWPGAQITLTAAPFFSGVGPEALISIIEARILNDALASLAARTDGVAYFDLSGLYNTDGPDLPARATYDGVHLTGAAYQRWQSALEQFLQAPR